MQGEVKFKMAMSTNLEMNSWLEAAQAGQMEQAKADGTITIKGTDIAVKAAAGDRFRFTDFDFSTPDAVLEGTAAPGAGPLPMPYPNMAEADPGTDAFDFGMPVIDPDVFL